MTNDDLNKIFGRYWSRNEANTITALHEAGFCLDDLDWLVEIGAVKKLVFGALVHYERNVTSELALKKLIRKYNKGL